jgi:hypothetical protein
VTDRSQNLIIVTRAVVVHEQNDWPQDRGVACEHLCCASRRDFHVEALEVLQERHAGLHTFLTPRDVDVVASHASEGDRVAERLVALESFDQP